MNSEQVATRAGITYRQLDHWVRRGWLTPDDAHPGHGISREWDRAAAERAVIMGRLVTAGMAPAAAADAAAQAVGTETRNVYAVLLTPAVGLVVDLRAEPDAIGSALPVVTG